MKNFIKKCPFSTYAIFCLLFAAAIAILSHFFGSGYDDNGLGTVVFVLSVIWSFFAFPFYLASELLFLLNGGHGAPWHSVVAALIGLSFCLIADTVLIIYRKKYSRAVV